jgi:hypothetical protein
MAFSGVKLLSAEQLNSDNKGLSLFLCSINYILSLYKTRKKLKDVKYMGVVKSLYYYIDLNLCYNEFSVIYLLHFSIEGNH